MKRTENLNLPLFDPNDRVHRNAFNEIMELLDEKILKRSTAALFGLGTDAVPDDVFQVLSNMVGRYRIEMNLTFEGVATSGVQINGLETLNGEIVYTDATGNAVGYTYNPIGEIEIPQFFVDIPTITIPYDTGGKLLTTITYDAKTDGAELYEITTSGIYRFSGAFSELDFFLVGAGASGAIGCNAERVFTGGAGGYTKTLLGVQNDQNVFTCVIGAGGMVSLYGNNSAIGGNVVAGQNGGDTSISHAGTVLETAPGGTGGVYSNIAPTTTYTKVNGVAGGSGTGCGVIGNRRCSITSSGSNGSSGTNNTTYSSASGGSGQGTTTKAFGESSGTIAYSAAGGQAALYSDEDGESRDSSGGNGIADYYYRSNYAISEGTNYGDGGGAVDVKRDSTSTTTIRSEGMPGVIIVRRSSAS